jgi:hypothetical protein
MALARDDDLYSDGLRFVVDWDTLQVGGSFFFPCLNSTRALKSVGRVFEQRDWKYRFVVGVENHILGVRIWRTA